jgi:LPXTG-site transpeptidase (sortase) family protein
MLVRDRASGSSAGRLRRGIAGLLIVAGVAMLGWSALLVMDARVSQETAQRSLEIAARLESPAHPGPLAEDEVTPELSALAAGSPLGELLIPRVRLSSMVLHGSDTQTLRRGPGHIEQTAFPGERGNIAIAGHRDTFFRQLRNVQVGDDVFLNTPRGAFHYRITSTSVVNAHDLSVLDPTEHAVLTLITCYPFWVLGPAPDRFIVRAERVGEPAPLAPLNHHPVSVVSSTLPGISPRPSRQTATVTTRAVLDDDALIRVAIARFRDTYNAQLVRHNERRPGGLLTFSSCDVAIAGADATARCGTASRDSEQRELDLWTFDLDRVAGAWTIKSMAVSPVSDAGEGTP